MPRTRAAHSDTSQPPAKRPMSAATASSNLEEEIRRRAYELYELRGREDGFAEEDWTHAEREVLSRRGLRSA
jgi:hypothetical protein